MANLSPHETPKESYVSNTKAVLENGRDEADKLGITDAFFSEVHRLQTVNFSAAVDLSGFPNGDAHKDIMLRGLRERQRELGKLMRAD